MGSTTPLLDILSAHLPSGISSAEISSSNSSQLRPTVETLLSFAVGGECPTRLSDARQDWSLRQPAAIKALQDFLGPKGSKRAREGEETDDASSKRQKTADTDAADDPPLFTLPSISTTSPVRKKVDITIHERSLRFINTSTRAVEASIPIASISRAFLLPTRGKSKGHWTVVLLPTDVPDKGKALAPSSQQVIFGLDALSAAKFETTSYSSDSSAPTSTTTVAKGEETVASVRKLLSYLPVLLLEPSATIFRSACATARSGNGAAGLDAHIGAKSGTLWFFDSGILWGENKPSEFWAVSDLVPKDGIRLISATGRTCTVILSRKGGESKDANRGEDGKAEGDAGEEIVETEFTAIDGREQDPVHAWARHRKHLFGKTSVSPPSASDAKQTTSSGKETIKGPLPNGTAKGAAWDDSDSDDEDFEAASSEDLDTDNPDSDDSEDGGGSDDENGSQSEGAEESDDDQSEVEELLQAHHPLLRSGAMPRMSKAAMEDMVHDDLIGDASDEEDELDE